MSAHNALIMPAMVNGVVGSYTAGYSAGLAQAGGLVDVADGVAGIFDIF
ncbi:MAG: hypothetical protein ACRDXX_02805 [Stackebrandtia sp.]